jgi:hypothetical protein
MAASAGIQELFGNDTSGMAVYHLLIHPALTLPQAACFG